MATTYLQEIGSRLAGWSMEFDQRTEERATIAGLEVPVMFRGTFSRDQNRQLVHITCHVVDGQITTPTIEFQGFDVATFEALGLPAMLDVLTILVSTVGSAPLEADARPAAADELKRRRRRNAITDDRLREAAVLYERDGVDAVMAAFHVERRQAWRYIERAIKAGMVEARTRKTGR